MKSIKYIILTMAMVAGFGLVVMPTTVAAANSACDADPNSALCRACDADPNSVLCLKQTDSATSMVKIVVNALLYILGAVSVVMIIVGGVRYTTSMGDAKRIETAKDTILYAVVGLVVAILAYAIVNFVVTTIG